MGKSLVEKLSDEERIFREFTLNCISPDDSKYYKASRDLKDYLTADAEWRTCAYVQLVLLETRVAFGEADQVHVDRVSEALGKISPLNMALIEEQVTMHDQLAVIEEIGRFVPAETKALLHPGTTSYDILDTVRSYLFKKAWKDIIRPGVEKPIGKLCEIAENSMDVLQVGRTHLQDTSPVLFGGVIAGYAARLTERLERCDYSFNELRGKISGIVGTGASIDMVIGEGKSIDFEKAVLERLNLKPDYTASQIVQKERLCDVGQGLTTLMHVLGDFSNDIRMLYSSAIGEVVSRDTSARLGGSSSDASKDNPISWENMAGKVAGVESGMRVLYEMISSDFQRDLRSSVQARYQPQAMMTQTYEAFLRENKSLDKLDYNIDVIKRNLEKVRRNPSEAMVAILRGEQWVHPEFGVGHSFVKEMAKKAKGSVDDILVVALQDEHFEALYDSLPGYKQEILQGKLELYTGSAKERAMENLDYARSVIGGK